MTKLFQRFQFPRKQQQKQHQQVRKSLGSSSSVSSSYSTSIRMKSVRPASIYLQNQSSGRTGVNKYTCSPRLSLYLQEMQDGPQQLLWNQERAGHESRPSSSLLAGAQSRRIQLHDSSSRSLMEDLHTRTNQTRLADSGTRQQAPYEKDDASFSSLSTVGLCEERSNKEGEDAAAAGPSSSSSSSLRLRFEMSDYLNDNEFSMSMF